MSRGNVTHGLTRHPLYGIWRGLKKRCLNQNDKGYQRYGGRGIGICAEWMSSFVAFYKWAIQSGWKPGLQIDRRNNDEVLSFISKLAAFGLGIIFQSISDEKLDDDGREPVL